MGAPPADPSPHLDGTHRAAASAAGARSRGTAAEVAALNVLGDSPVFVDMLRQIAKIARAEAPVLIEGETGSGKEVAARAIHYLGPRRDKPFIPINCGAIPDTLIEAELFGHERGAFTDAHGARTGVVAQAQGGTLFLDEIDALSPKAQVTLLRFLQDMRYRPLGQSVEQTCDVRVVAAANRPLEELVAGGAFRRDLFYRLNILGLTIPPLRERAGDANLLAHHFLRTFAEKYGVRPKRLHPDTLEWIRTYEWPGNVRELENVIHRQVLLADTDEILFAGWPSPSDHPAGDAATDGGCGGFRIAKAIAVAEFDRRYLARVLADARGNVTVAARLAGKERRAFGRLLRKHQIDKNLYRG